MSQKDGGIMSKGNPRVTIRIDPALLSALEAELASQREYGVIHQWDVSAFIVAAIKEKIARRRASRAKRNPSAAQRRADSAAKPAPAPKRPSRAAMARATAAAERRGQ